MTFPFILSEIQGPDEIARMKEIGNARAEILYGGVAQRPKPDASDSEWLRYLKHKYEQRQWAQQSKNLEPHGVSSRISVVRKDADSSPKAGVVHDLLNWHNDEGVLPAADDKPKSNNKNDDFFSEFGL
jgi:hypothetical protein